MKWSMMLSALLLVSGMAEMTEAKEGLYKCCKSCGKKICQAELKTKKVKEKYYDVECVDVCIPGIRFPWSKKDCCEAPKCGRVRTIQRLVVKEREVEKCVWEWKIVELCDECQHSCDHGCPTGHCEGEIIHYAPAGEMIHPQTVPHSIPLHTQPMPEKVEHLPVTPMPKGK